MKIVNVFFRLLVLVMYSNAAIAQPGPENNLSFSQLATQWDEAIPLGNGMIGALIWQKEDKLRLSLDRADIWDERQALDIGKHNFKWVQEQVRKKQVSAIHQWSDVPYEDIAYPTKLPAAAIEFDLGVLGKQISNELDISRAVNTVRFDNGIEFKCIIYASKNQGYFEFSNMGSANIEPALKVPAYQSDVQKGLANSVEGLSLEKLGYAQGIITRTKNTILYHQPTYAHHYYEVMVAWKDDIAGKVTGSWTLTVDQAAVLPIGLSVSETTDAWEKHELWWNDFWKQSSVSVPDKQIEKQYYLDMYKFGAAGRKGSPAITLQAVWTADNGNLPPWKGDFHNDLNTQLSYWPAYTANHLREAESFTDWLWKTRKVNMEYTRKYFGVEGLNVPGVATLNGYPMGGWIQYSLSATVSAWTAQHFYWQWKYSMDKHFLEQEAYPYIEAAALYLKNITVLKNGKRSLPLSASPEYNNNAINAWFHQWTNYDLTLAKFLFTAAAEVNEALGKKNESSGWLSVLNQLPDFNTNETGLTVAPGEDLAYSHRHMSPYMSIYPMALLDVNRAKDKEIIERSLQHIEKMGTREWVGYSFSWAAILYARAYHADSAVAYLTRFASNFCSVNSFHLNGDQKSGQYSSYTYRPFTLEGNFAFAQGVHELLLQSRGGYVEVFPAVPESWRDVSFHQLRAEGAWLIDGEKKNGVVEKITVQSEKGGVLKIKLPAGNWYLAGNPGELLKPNAERIFILPVKAGQSIIFQYK
ncbi:MAG: glycoside hydrolase N-terminal domain-containing protein [Flavitalea sp.]